MRTAEEFRATVRSGKRAGTRRLVVHAVAGPPRAGFIVSKAVGPAVVRHRVKRRLRHLMRDRLADQTVVVRALPAAGAATSGELADDLDTALGRCR